MVSCDTLKKLYVTNFPNVFDMQSVMQEHTKAITQMCPFGSLVATAAEVDPEAET
jgi:hypothetical protein